jgi:uncharacterized protein (UPF0335 family)
VTAATQISGVQLKIFVEQLEKLDNEKRFLLEAINDIFTNAKAIGYDPSILKEVMEIYKIKKDVLFQENDLFDIYKNIGKWADKEIKASP